MDNTRFATRCDEKQKVKIQDLCHEKKKRGQTNADLIIKALDQYDGEVKKWIHKSDKTIRKDHLELNGYEGEE